MKSKQLANVLIKILGLYLLAESLPTTLSYLGQLSKVSEIHTASFSIISLVSCFVLATLSKLAISLFFLFRIKSIAEFLFKNEEE